MQSDYIIVWGSVRTRLSDRFQLNPRPIVTVHTLTEMYPVFSAEQMTRLEASFLIARMDNVFE